MAQVESMSRSWIVLGFAGLALVGCKATASAEPAAAPTPDALAPSADDAGVAWAEMSQDQKIRVMKEKVMPAVAAVWTDSPNPEATVDCGTCHGARAQQGDFQMPNPDLPALNPADSFAAHQDDAAWLEFMMSTLTPTMVNALDVEGYNPQTNEGFGCFACHTMAGA